MERDSWLKDYDKVVSVIKNKKNEEKHFSALKQLVSALDRKWCYSRDIGLYNIAKCEMVYPLYDELEMKNETILK